MRTWNIKVKKIIESLTYEKKMFFRLMSLVTIPLIVMGIVSYTIYVQGESERTRITLGAYGDEISKEYENIFSAIRDYYIESVSSDAVRWLERQEEVPYSKFSYLRNAQSVLEGNYFMEHYIESFEYINLNYGWVFNDYGLFPYEDMKNKEVMELFLKEQKEMPLSVYWQNRTGIEKPLVNKIRMSNTVDSSGLLLIVKKEIRVGNPSYMLMVCLDEDALADVAHNYQKLGYDITVLRNGKVFLETNPEMTQRFLSDGMNHSGDMIGNDSKNEYRIYAKNGDTSGLTYVIGYDTSQVKKGGTIFMLASFVVLLAFGLLLALVRVTAIAFSKPLLKLEKFVDDQNTQIKELLVANMLKGELTEEKIQTALKTSEIEPWTVYRMIVMNCKETERKEEELRERIGEILNHLPETLRKRLFITPIIYHDKLVLLVGASADGEIDLTTAELYKEIKDYIAESFGLAMASGISQPFHKLHHMGRAYSECAQALYNKSNRDDMDNSSLVLYDDYLATKQGSNVYDLIMETELIQAIKSCNEKEAIRLTEIIIQRMEVKNVVGIERSLYLSRLLAAILNIPIAAGIALTDVFESEQYNVMNHITQIYDKRKLATAISEEVILPIMGRISKKNQEEDSSEIVKVLLGLLKDSKGNISLNECAEQLNYHPNYLSKVLKKEKGITFMDMANEEKLKQAKYMLLTTDYSIAELAEKLQYNNVQNFIRFFKNQVGVTPAVFRREHIQ